MTTTVSTNGVGGLQWNDLSSQVRPRRRYDGAVPPPGDEAAEGHLRLILARKVADVLGQRPEAARGIRAFSVFTPAEIEMVETLIVEEVTGHQLEQTSLGLPGLQDAEGARQRLRAGLVGMAQLHGPFDDPDVEDICAPGRSM